MNFNNSNSPLTGAFYTCTHKWATDCVYREAGVTREKRSREVAKSRGATSERVSRGSPALPTSSLVPCVGKIGDYLDV